MKLTKPIESQRIVLKSLEPTDAESYWQRLNDPKINRFLEVRYIEQNLQSVKKFIAEKNSSSHDLLLGLFLRDSEQHFGNIKISFSWHNCRGEIGIVLWDQKLWGKGLGAEAIKALLNYTLDNFKLKKTCASAYSSNIASINSFQKAGFIIEGQLKEHLRDGENWVDQVFMAFHKP